MNILQLITSNPQSIIKNALGNNPMAGNLINLVNNKDSKGIEQMARNLAKEKGLDADKIYNQMKSQFGL